MKRISTLLLLNLVFISPVMSQSPYVIYHAVDELYTYTTPIPQNNVTTVNLSYYTEKNALVSNLRQSLYTSVDYTHNVDNQVKANYLFDDYGRTATGLRATYRNDEKAYQRVLVASVTSTYTQSTGIIQKGDYATIATFDSDMPKTVDFTKVFNLVGINGESSQLTYGIKGIFAMVSEANTYPKLITPTDAQLPYVSTQFATLSVPEFYTYFPENQIGWKQDGKEIKKATGYTFTFSKEFDDSLFIGCSLHSYQPFIKNPKFAFWTAGSIQIELSPNLTMGSDLFFQQPLCRENQNNGNNYKSAGHLLLGQRVVNNIYKVTYSDKNGEKTGHTLDMTPSSIPYLPEKSPFKINIIIDFQNGYQSCAQYFENLQIDYAKPISIVDSTFTDIRCHGDKPLLNLSVDGNAMGYTISYGDSARAFAKNQDLGFSLSKGSRDYDFRLRDDNGCVYEKQLNFKATEPSELEAILNILNANCHDGEAVVSILAMGGTPISKDKPYNYTFMQGLEKQDGYVSTSEIKAGNRLTPRVYDANQCLAILRDTVLHNPSDFEIKVTDIQHNSCPKAKEGSIAVTCQSVDSSYRYSYSIIGVQQHEPFFKGLASGSHQILASNQYGCPHDTMVRIKEPPRINIAPLTLSPVRCYGEHNGSVLATVAGGTGTKKLWLISDGNASPKQTKNQAFTVAYDSLSVGNYWFHAQDSLGCRDSIGYSMGARSSMIHPFAMVEPSCDESRDGMLWGGALNGVAPYKSEWVYPEHMKVTESNTSGRVLQDSLGKGMYVLKFTDALGCTALHTFNITAPPTLAVKLDGYPLLCKGQSLDLDAGDKGVKYQWTADNGFTSNTRKISLSQSGVYKVVVTNGFGCKGSDSIVVQQSDTEFRADFWVASTVSTEDTVVLLNNNGQIDSLRWQLDTPNIMLPNSPNPRLQEALFPQLGEQEVSMIGYYKGCRDILTKRIQVVEPIQRFKNDRAIGIKTSVVKDCRLYPNPNDGGFEVVVELQESGVPVALTLSSPTTGAVIKTLDWKLYPNGKVQFTEDLPEGSYVIHVKVRDEVIALRFLIAYD